MLLGLTANKGEQTQVLSVWALVYSTLVKRCTAGIVRPVDSIRRFRGDIIVSVVHEL